MTPRSTVNRSTGFFTLLMLLWVGGCQHSLAQRNDSPGPTLQSAQATSARVIELTDLADRQFNAGNLSQCKQTVTEALKLAPANGTLHVLNAKLRIEAGQFEIAAQELKLARAFGCSTGEMFYLSGLVDQKLQKPETAYEFYQQAASNSPANADYVLAQSEMLVTMKRVPEATQLLQGKVDSFPENAGIRDSLGQMLMQAGQYPQAVALFRQASEFSQNDPVIRQRLALALYATGDYRECATKLTSLITGKPYAARADLFVMLGECQLHLNDAQTARATLETATQLDGTLASAWQGRGQAELETGHLASAEVCLTHSIWLDSANASSRLLLGYTHICQNRYDDALVAFQKASEADARDTVSVCMIGFTLEQLGRRNEAANYYQHALQMKPNDPMAEHLMASINPNDFGN